jgi:hypothetical protein
MTRTPRGSALLVAVIALLVMSVLGIGILRFGYREVAGASAVARQEAMAACAEAARQLMASRFHALGADPTTLPSLDVNLGAGVTAVGGHYGDTSTSGIQVTQVKVLPLSAFGPATATRDLTNVVAKDAVAKQPMKVVVRCRNASGVELEMEFGVKFGL